MASVNDIDFHDKNQTSELLRKKEHVAAKKKSRSEMLAQLQNVLASLLVVDEDAKYYLLKKALLRMDHEIIRIISKLGFLKGRLGEQNKKNVQLTAEEQENFLRNPTQYSMTSKSSQLVHGKKFTSREVSDAFSGLLELMEDMWDQMDGIINYENSLREADLNTIAKRNTEQWISEEMKSDLDVELYTKAVGSEKILEEKNKEVTLGEVKYSGGVNINGEMKVLTRSSPFRCVETDPGDLDIVGTVNGVPFEWTVPESTFPVVTGIEFGTNVFGENLKARLTSVLKEPYNMVRSTGNCTVSGDIVTADPPEDFLSDPKVLPGFMIRLDSSIPPPAGGTFTIIDVLDSTKVRLSETPPFTGVCTYKVRYDRRFFVGTAKGSSTAELQNWDELTIANIKTKLEALTDEESHSLVKVEDIEDPPGVHKPRIISRDTEFPPELTYDDSQLYLNEFLPATGKIGFNKYDAAGMTDNRLFKIECDGIIVEVFLEGEMSPDAVYTVISGAITAAGADLTVELIPPEPPSGYLKFTGKKGSAHYIKIHDCPSLKFIGLVPGFIRGEDAPYTEIDFSPAVIVSEPDIVLERTGTIADCIITVAPSIPDTVDLVQITGGYYRIINFVNETQVEVDIKPPQDTTSFIFREQRINLDFGSEEQKTVIIESTVAAEEMGIAGTNHSITDTLELQSFAIIRKNDIVATDGNQSKVIDVADRMITIKDKIGINPDSVIIQSEGSNSAQDVILYIKDAREQVTVKDTDKISKGLNGALPVEEVSGVIDSMTNIMSDWQMYIRNYKPAPVEEYDEILNDLQAQKFDRAVDELLRCALDIFMSLEANESTYAGVSASSLNAVTGKFGVAGEREEIDMPGGDDSSLARESADWDSNEIQPNVSVDDFDGNVF